MSAYEGKSIVIDAVQVTATNKEDIARSFGFTVSGGNLYNDKGAIVNTGVWVCRLNDGTIKQFTDELFNKLFSKIEPPTYKLSDIPDFANDIQRKGWVGLYLRNMGYCFVQCDEEGIVGPYTFTADDFAADDWMIKED